MSAASAAARRPLVGGGRGLAVYFVVAAVLLYLPIGILFVFSVNDATTLSFPLRGLTSEWYARAIESDALLRSARNSLVVAASSATVATTLATLVGIAALRFRFRLKPVLVALAVLPLVVPFVVLAVALLILFRAFDVDLSLATVGAAHSIVALPYALLIVAARLVGVDRRLEEAAMDLGASYPTTLRLVVLPIVAPAVVAAWLTAFTVSFDEFALALFLAGNEPTFPVYLFGQLRFTSTLPVMIAMAVMLMTVSLALVLAADRIRRWNT